MCPLRVLSTQEGKGLQCQWALLEPAHVERWLSHQQSHKYLFKTTINRPLVQGLGLVFLKIAQLSLQN